jgi:hypothetical protein
MTAANDVITGDAEQQPAGGRDGIYTHAPLARWCPRFHPVSPHSIYFER